MAMIFFITIGSALFFCKPPIPARPNLMFVVCTRLFLADQEASVAS